MRCSRRLDSSSLCNKDFHVFPYAFLSDHRVANHANTDVGDLASASKSDVVLLSICCFRDAFVIFSCFLIPSLSYD